MVMPTADELESIRPTTTISHSGTERYIAWAVETIARESGVPISVIWRDAVLAQLGSVYAKDRWASWRELLPVPHWEIKDLVEEGRKSRNGD